MKLYYLTPLYPDNHMWCQMDTVHGFVVRSPDEQTARQLAQEQAADENYTYDFSEGFLKGKRISLDVWLDPKWTSCEEIFQDGPAEIICRDFHGS